MLALPQVREVGRARLGPFGLGVGFAQVNVDAHAASPGHVGQVQQRLGVQGVGGVRGDAHGRRGRHRVQRLGDFAFTARPPLLVRPAHDLPVGDAVQARVVQGRGRGGVRHHVGGGGRAALQEQARARGRVASPVQAARVVNFVEGARPAVETAVLSGSHGRHARVLQVRVRIDEAGEQHALKVAFHEGKAALRERLDDPVARAHVFDAPVAHGNSAVEDRGGGDRDDHAGGPDDHVAHRGPFSGGR